MGRRYRKTQDASIETFGVDLRDRREMIWTSHYLLSRSTVGPPVQGQTHDQRQTRHLGGPKHFK